jgi:hypothetical protein
MKNYTMNYDLACRVSDYLLKTGEKYATLDNCERVTREDCQKVIDDFNTIKYEINKDKK